LKLSPGAITDVAGLRVGHAQAQGRATGCTVLLCPPGTVGGVAQRGGAPGTRETDLLRPENTVDVVHALLLTGGSAFGLDAAGGVMRWLEERGVGLPVGPQVRVPIVPAAVLFDLWLGDSRIRPDAGTGYAACEAALPQAPAQGNVGAGAGAVVGKLFGIERAMRGGLGTASLRWGQHTVAALVAVNAIGDIVDDAGRPLAGARSADGGALHDSSAALLNGDMPPRWQTALQGTATTIGVVATDARLTKAQAAQLASLAHHGLARAIRPLTAHDGDTLFALCTGTAGPAEISALGALAAEVVARAIRNAVLAAEGLPPPGLPSARSLGQPHGPAGRG
jgi:L-aminopeptidase/D-esterase-like protein